MRKIVLSVAAAALATTGVLTGVSSSSAQAAVPQCGNDDLRASYASRGAGAGHQYGVIRLKNVSDHACRTGGYGGLSYVGHGDGTQVGAAADRDRGPVRKTVRDVVDSRRNVGSWFLAIAGVALIGTFVPSAAVRGYSSFLLFGFFLLLIVDSVVLNRKIKRTLAERFPAGTEKVRGASW